MNFQTKNGLYFDLDVLYDTRLATLELIDPRLAKRVLSENYFKRTHDSFPFISRDDFRSVYNIRNEALLEKATVTKMPVILDNFIKEAVVRVNETPYKGDINVFLNTYPYNLDRNKAIALLDPLSKMTGNFAKVHALNMSPEQLTLKFCRDNFSLMVMYDFEDWLEIHTKNDAFRNTPIPDIPLFVPELFLTSQPPSMEDLKSITRETGHPFRALERYARSVIDIGMIDISYYCADYPPEFLNELLSGVKKDAA